MTTIDIRGACPHDCPDACALLVTVKDGVAIAVHGDPDHPPTSGVHEVTVIYATSAPPCDGLESVDLPPRQGIVGADIPPLGEIVVQTK